jgi:hypothetical protein
MTHGHRTECEENRNDSADASLSLGLDLYGHDSVSRAKNLQFRVTIDHCCFTSTLLMPVSVFSSESAASVDLLQHLALERISPQWSGFLGVLSDELQTQLTATEYRALLVSLGVRFAQAFELPACNSLKDIEAEVNKYWFRFQWGFAVFSDVGRQLQIAHHACPLPAALQIDSDFAGGFLEGAYATWLRAAGSPAELELKQLPAAGIPMHMVFELSVR